MTSQRTLSLTTRFLIAALVIVGGAMALLGQWISTRIEAGLIRGRADSGALYMEGFLAPYVQELASSSTLPQVRQDELDRFLTSNEMYERIAEVRIWLRDGTIAYSNDKALIGSKFPSADIEAAFSGRIVSQIERRADDEQPALRPSTQPLLEVYAPIYRTGTGDIIAVGEFYEKADAFLADLAASRSATWAIVGGITAAMMGLFLIIVRQASNVIDRQRVALREQLVDAQALAGQNDRLRLEAERTRMEASQSNEALLNRVGADLHDGPIQLISLLILKLSDNFDNRNTTAAETGVKHLADQALTELREISSGLVLPEIETMPLEVALRLAVARHRDATATNVRETYEDLPSHVPHPLKICLYRIAQEGLNNAYRHGGGKDQSLSAVRTENEIILSVTDKGVGIAAPAGQTKMRRTLGLGGIKYRVESFGGRLDIRSQIGVGTELQVRIPLAGNVATAPSSSEFPAGEEPDRARDIHQASAPQ